MYNGDCVTEVGKGSFTNRTNSQKNHKDSYSPENQIKPVIAMEDEIMDEEQRVDKKLIKILQRPTTARSADGRLQPEEGPRRNHRKKTLSLNPEEREALESLIEDVIIVGLDDVIVDSDDSTDEVQNWGSQRYSQKLNNSQRSRLRGSQVEHKLDSQKMIEPVNNRNNSTMEFIKSRDSSFGNSKNARDVARSNEISQNLQQQPSKMNDEDVKEKTVNGMVGINIYPAQLKVAIKHMDSLPPRFLRRLQSGQARIGGSDPALPNLSEPINRENLLKAVEGSVMQSNSTPNSIEKDKSRAKQNHLFETKKSIRNLLDQYSDDVTHHSEAGDDLKVGRGEEIPTVPMDVFKTSSYDARAGIFRSQPNQMFGSDPHLNTFDPYAPLEFMNLQMVSRNSQREFFQAGVDRSNSFGTAFAPNGLPHNVSPKPGSTVGHAFSYSGVNGYVPYEAQQRMSFAPLPPLPKKTNLKPDAPVFVSNYYNANKTNEQVQTSNNPVRIGENEIAFLPGVLNTENHQNYPKQMAPTAIEASYNMSYNPNMAYKNIQPSNMYMEQPQYNMVGRGMYQGQQFSPPNNHAYLASSPGAWTADVPTMDAAMPWYTGFHMGAEGMMKEGFKQMGGDSEMWMGFNAYNDVLGMELGRQRVIELLNAGRCVMVLLLGNPDGSKLSELQISGVHILNVRNNMSSNGSPTKQKEQQEWNYRQAVEAVDGRKDLIIVDHTFAKPWEMHQYINLAQRNHFEVQIIDGSQPTLNSDTMGMYMPSTNGFKHHGGHAAYREILANQMLPINQVNQSDFSMNQPIQSDYAINHA